MAGKTSSKSKRIQDNEILKMPLRFGEAVKLIVSLFQSDICLWKIANHKSCRYRWLIDVIYNIENTKLNWNDILFTISLHIYKHRFFKLNGFLISII